MTAPLQRQVGVFLGIGRGNQQKAHRTGAQGRDGSQIRRASRSTPTGSAWVLPVSLRRLPP